MSAPYTAWDYHEMQNARSADRYFDRLDRELELEEKGLKHKLPKMTQTDIREFMNSLKRKAEGEVQGPGAKQPATHEEKMEVDFDHDGRADVVIWRKPVKGGFKRVKPVRSRSFGWFKRQKLFSRRLRRRRRYY